MATRGVEPLRWSGTRFSLRCGSCSVASQPSATCRRPAGGLFFIFDSLCVVAKPGLEPVLQKSTFQLYILISQRVCLSCFLTFRRGVASPCVPWGCVVATCLTAVVYEISEFDLLVAKPGLEPVINPLKTYLYAYGLRCFL